jgi:methionyl-tRNA formyltransferase
MNPEPMAFTTAGSQTIRILDALEFFDTETETAPPGTLVSKANRVFVVCGSNSLLELKQLQPAGKNVMSAMDWYRGASGNVNRFDGGLA